MGDLSVSITFYFATKRRRDLDNMNKLVLDALTGIAYDDDSQIAELHLYRAYDVQKPRIEARLPWSRSMTEYTYYSTGVGFLDRYRVERAEDGFHVRKVTTVLRETHDPDRRYGEILGTGTSAEAAIAIIKERSHTDPVRMRNPFPD